MGLNDEELFPFFSQLKRAMRKITTDITSHVAAADPHPGYVTTAELGATKLDDLAAPDDNTDLNASTTKHGLLRKLDNNAAHYLDGTGAWSVPAGGGGFTPDFGIWVPDAPPASAGSEDDEFDGAGGAGVPAGWTEVDHGGTQTVSEDEAGLKLLSSGPGSFQWSGIYKAIPAGDFTIWAKMSLSAAVETDFSVIGLGLWQDATSASGDLATIGLHVGAGTTAIGAYTWSSYTTFASTLNDVTIHTTAGTNALYFRIRRTGTTYAYDYSYDGLNWLRVYSGALGFTPTHFGPVIGAQTTTAAGRAYFFRYVASDVGMDGLVNGDRVGMARK